MFKKIIIFILLVVYPIISFADNLNEPKPDDMQIVPLAQFENMILTSQHIESSSGGLLINSEDMMFIGLYTQHQFHEPLQYDFPNRYHTIDMLLDVKDGRDQYLGIFKSQSDKPVSGGINTFQAAAVYGYEMIDEPHLSVVLGGGIAVGNFGVKTPDGKNWPIIPVPLARVNYHGDWIDAKFEFLTSPNLSFTIAPKGHVRLTGDVRMDQMRDSRDIIYEVALAYRPYSVQDEMGDFVGVSLGIKNNNYGAFQLGHKDEKESIETHYKAVFVELDVSVLKLTAGYAFDGRSLYRETQKQDLGKGMYMSIQAMYPF